MGGSLIQNATTITSTDFKGNINIYANDTLMCTAPSTITITGTDIDPESISKVKFTIDTQTIYLYIRDSAGRSLCEIVSQEKNKVVLKTQIRFGYRLSRKLQGVAGQEITLKGASENIKQGTVTEAYTSSFPLTEIDDLREYILSKGREQVRIGKKVTKN